MNTQRPGNLFLLNSTRPKCSSLIGNAGMENFLVLIFELFMIYQQGCFTASKTWPESKKMYTHTHTHTL